MNVVASLEGVSKTYGDGESGFVALRDVSLSVARGEVVMLSGPSGSGKTSALSILGCVLRATSGAVTLLGENVTALAEHELARRRLAHVGFVFQSHNLLASLTAEENVSMLARMRSWSKIKARDTARELLAAVGLEGKEDALPGALSGGERQRVAIARGLIGAPPLMLADEPTASLDAANGLVATTLLRDLARTKGIAVVIVTHDPRIFHLADRRVHMEDGQIVETQWEAA
jgi:putative ABC transport system ATP-binding protein